MPETSRTNLLFKRLLALVVLVIAAYILARVIIGFLSGIFTIVLVIAALVAVVWAYSTLRRR